MRFHAERGYQDERAQAAAPERGDVGRDPSAEAETDQRARAGPELVEQARGHDAELGNGSHPLGAVRSAEARELRGDNGVVLRKRFEKRRGPRDRDVAMQNDDRWSAAELGHGDIAGREGD